MIKFYLQIRLVEFFYRIYVYSRKIGFLTTKSFEILIFLIFFISFFFLKLQGEGTLREFEVTAQVYVSSVAFRISSNSL